MLQRRVIPGIFFSVLGHLVLPYEVVRVFLILRALFEASASDRLICPVDLPLTDLSLVVRIFQGKRLQSASAHFP